MTKEAEMKRLLFPGLALAAVVGATGGVAANTPMPYGTWKYDLSLDEAHDKGYDPRMRGAYRLVIAKNGTYRWFHALSGGWASGTFTVSGQRIVFAGDTGCAQPGFTKKGFYRSRSRTGH